MREASPLLANGHRYIHEHHHVMKKNKIFYSIGYMQTGNNESYLSNKWLILLNALPEKAIATPIEATLLKSDKVCQYYINQQPTQLSGKISGFSTNSLTHYLIL